MSQHVTISCNVLDDVDIKTLKRAIKAVNKDYDIISVKKLQKHGRKTYATFKNDAMLTVKGNPIPVGFRFEPNEDKLRMVIEGEFWRQPWTPEQFKNMICHEYTNIKIEDMIRKENMQVISHNITEDETIEIRVAV